MIKTGQIIVDDRPIKYRIKTDGRRKRLSLEFVSKNELLIHRPKRLSLLNTHFIILKNSRLIKKLLKNRLPSLENDKVDEARLYKKYKEKARLIIKAKVDRFNKLYNFKYNKIRIKRQKTCFGSCSAKGNLNFNYKLLFMPDRLSDYIVAHELCHLAELNHGKRFWQLVSITIPEYKDLKKQLKGDVFLEPNRT